MYPVSLKMLITLLTSTTLISCPCILEYIKFTNDFDRIPSNEGCYNFCSNLRKIKSHNNNPVSTYSVGIKPFHDLPYSLYNSKGCYPSSRNKETDTFATMNDFNVTTPRHINWFEQGRVTDIRDQGSCGDCWAESAVGVLESLYQQQYGDLNQLSVQQAAECSPQEFNMGCEGGWPISVLQYVKNITGGLCSEKNYPTIIGNGIDTDCNSTESKLCNIPIKLRKILSIPTGNENMLEVAVSNDVVSVAIDASGEGFNAYTDGIYNGMFDGQPDCQISELDHAVVTVGIGTRVKDGMPYYLVRNSWGDENWGNMNGYILFLRGNNTCGIAQDAVCVN